MLQWGRDLSAAEGSYDQEHNGRSEELQWGRDLSAAEGPVVVRRRLVDARFNGAATFRPRKAAVPAMTTLTAWLQWGRDLSAAEGP